MHAARILCAIAIAAALAGCASTPAPPRFADLPWQDGRFAYDPALVTVSAQDIFRLDPDVAALIAEDKPMSSSPLSRTKRLLTLIFGPQRDQFAYQAGHTTVAAETWREKRGDCISLTVLAYSAARAMHLDADMQEVGVPALYVRQRGFEFVNHHVNLVVHVPPTSMEGKRELVVDFNPDAPPGRLGDKLSEQAIVARVYSNLAAELLTQGRYRHAYAYLKAALANDPAHAPTYTNIALLYRREGLDAQAERMLRVGVALGTQPETAMHALFDLLREQGRDPEAAVVQAQLERRQEADPYYWIARGTSALAEGRPADAVRSLLRADALVEGFGEVHRQLAIAYWQLGRRDKAREQVVMLEAADRGSPLAPKFKKMLQTP
ncbi:MAG TPA: tetratricopeptide repeat protein [Ramlibacter sp.]|uniref:tetratricopeptide repeat protein n=1 Tax=Ramlibacter sp. TaxID=1917967 RepID=UPI002C6661A1|nr:tetratricopeptide repeat protein [Ramlibacter sp.]HVZ46031.1 tetratricopeptide repeat protein [Ramlibacter sp.]